MLVSISYFNAPKGFVTLYVYTENGILRYWFPYLINERLKLHKLLSDMGVKRVVLSGLNVSDLLMFQHLDRHFDLTISQ